MAPYVNIGRPITVRDEILLLVLLPRLPTDCRKQGQIAYEPNLHTSTDRRTRSGLRMIDHRLGGCRQDVGMVLQKTATAGFLLPTQTQCVDSGALGASASDRFGLKADLLRPYYVRLQVAKDGRWLCLYYLPLPTDRRA